MALIPHTFMPRSLFDMDSWFKPSQHHLMGPTTLDMFDPFDEMDRAMSRNLQWLNKPAALDVMPTVPKVPQKYRITLDCRGYKSSSIKTEVKDGKLFIKGQESFKKENGDFSNRDFHKTYTLPEDVDAEKLVSFLTSNGQLVIEIPFKNHGLGTIAVNESLFPKIVDDGKGKRVTMRLNLPKNIDASKLTVTCKDRDIIVKGEDKLDKPDCHSQTYYYQRTTLPENTDFEALKCTYDNDHHLSINAPLIHNALEHHEKKAIKH